ncbi:acylphosphatase [Magnetococcus sp. PR-3]|uniref:acylphosphatase n=1 Tax=Magnetococcus sp. PR-3 TaxID=3120355 RepID=UPI002FCE29EF
MVKPQLAMHVWISGRVQGVWYRHHTHLEAQRLGLQGWVRNLPDGRVEALFQGPEDAVTQAVEWCHQGSPKSQVEGVESRPCDVDDARCTFEVRR